MTSTSVPDVAVVQRGRRAAAARAGSRARERQCLLCPIGTVYATCLLCPGASTVPAAAPASSCSPPPVPVDDALPAEAAAAAGGAADPGPPDASRQQICLIGLLTCAGRGC
jgi:hypothetical protein